MLQYLSGHFQKLKLQRHKTESFLFYLNCRVTFLFLMACCIVVTSNFFAGDPIVCTKALDVPSEVMASYCWSHSTYSIASAYGKKVGREVPYPGIDTSENQSDYIYRDYYQWIYLVLFTQGVLFYVPHALWKGMEAGKMEQLFKNIMNPPPTSSDSEDDCAEKAKKMSHNGRLLAGAVFFHKRWGWYNRYALCYWFCEILSLLNIVFQAYFLDSFFQGEFLPLGKRAMEYFENRHFHDNPLSWVFPRLTKCHFHKFGSSGNVETVDVLCVLPVNALTEKIYLLIWFWLFALFVMSSVGIVLTFLTLICPKIRGIRLSLSLTSELYCSSSEIVFLASDVGQRCGYGDWFVLSALAETMDILDFKQFLGYLQDEHVMSTKRSKTLNKFKEGATAV